MKANLAFPAAGFAELRNEGLLEAPLVQQWGERPCTHGLILDALRQVGARDLSLGRLYEGHVNALLLIARYGNRAQALQDVRSGMGFGVWNTDEGKNGVRALREGNLLRFFGCKAFASGAGTILRPVVTAEVEGEGRVMCVMPMEAVPAAIDLNSWHPIGMQASDSFTVDFSGTVLPATVTLGEPGDYYRQPAFGGGAIRFAAVQFGAIEQLASRFRLWLRQTERMADPYQQARVGEVAIRIESGRQWIAFAAQQAERYFDATSEPEVGTMLKAANMTRLAMERICLETIELVTRGIGARGLLQEEFSKPIRDLTMYLRQPAPDQALADVGRRELE